MPSADRWEGVWVCVGLGGGGRTIKMMHYRHLEKNKWLRSERESEPQGERLHRFQINADVSAILPVNLQQVLLLLVPVRPLARSWALATAWPSFLSSRGYEPGRLATVHVDV